MSIMIPREPQDNISRVSRDIHRVIDGIHDFAENHGFAFTASVALSISLVLGGIYALIVTLVG